MPPAADMLTPSQKLRAQVMSGIDVLYMTRVQKERFPSQAEYDAVKDVFKITPETMAMVRIDRGQNQSTSQRPAPSHPYYLPSIPHNRASRAWC